MPATITSQFRKNNALVLVNKAKPVLTKSAVNVTGTNVPLSSATNFSLAIASANFSSNILGSNNTIGVPYGGIPAGTPIVGVGIAPGTVTTATLNSDNTVTILLSKPLISNTTATTYTFVISDVANIGATPLWIGIGKTDSWPTVNDIVTVKTPDSSLADSNAALANLVTLNQITAAELMFPANAWQTNRIYKPYDSGDDGCFYATVAASGSIHYPCYVNVNNLVYLCVRRKLNTSISTTSPTGNDQGVIAPALLAAINNDDYCWAYLYEIDNVAPRSILNTSTFKALTSLGNTTTSNSRGIFLYAQPINPITGASIDLPSLTNVTSIMLHWTGTYIASGATVTAQGGSISIFNSTLKTITYSAVDAAVANNTRIISYASITVTMQTAGYTAIAFRPVITAVNGIAYDLTKVLPCWYAGFATEFNGGDAETLDLIKTNNYCQISLVNDPKNNSAYPAGVDPMYSKNCLRYIVINSSITGNLSDLNDRLISQCDSLGDITANGAIGIIDYAVNNITTPFHGRIYFHQNSDIGSGSNMNMFNAASGYISISTSTEIIVKQYTTAIAEPEYARGTGEVLFLENRLAIERSTNQSEAIKLIIQL